MVNFNRFISPFFEEYGQGELAMTLLILLAKRFYGDSLRFKREPGLLQDIKFTDTEDMLNLVQGVSSSAVILFELVSQEEQEYFAKVTQIFTNQPAPAGKVYSVNEAYQAVKIWWEKLPIIARSLDFYKPEHEGLADVCSQIKLKDPFYFIKRDLITLVGLEAQEVITKTRLIHIEIYLKDFKAAAESIQSLIEEKILKEIAPIFNAKSHLDMDIQEALKNWYSQLSSAQRDPMGIYHNNDSKPLIKNTSYTKIRELFFEELPENYAFGKVSNWISDYTDKYISRINAGKQHIELNAPKVTQIKLEFENGHEQKGSKVTYRNQIKIHADTEDGTGTIYYTYDGSDPIESRTRQVLQPGDQLTIHGNRRVKFTVADEKGNYGSVNTLDFIDELEQHVIKRNPQTSLLQEPITFIFPTNKDGAKTTLSSLLKELLKAGIFIDSQDLQILINTISKELD
jgi:hypothetical protein